MHWTAVSAARGASRAAELAAKVTSAQDVLPTSGLLATAMEMPNISVISHLKVTHITCMHDYKLHLAEDDTATYLRCLKIQSL